MIDMSDDVAKALRMVQVVLHQLHEHIVSLDKRVTRHTEEIDLIKQHLGIQVDPLPDEEKERALLNGAAKDIHELESLFRLDSSAEQPAKPQPGH